MATPRGLACGTSSSSFILGLAVGGRVVFPPLQSVLSPPAGRVCGDTVDSPLQRSRKDLQGFHRYGARSEPQKHFCPLQTCSPHSKPSQPPLGAWHAGQVHPHLFSVWQLGDALSFPRYSPSFRRRRAACVGTQSILPCSVRSHLSVQHFTLHQPGQGRQGLSFVAEGAAAHDSVRLHISVWGISPPPPRRGSTDGSKQRLQGFCSTAVAFLPPTERSDRGNTAVGHRTRVLQPKGDNGLRPILDLRHFNFPSTKGNSRCWW